MPEGDSCDPYPANLFLNVLLSIGIEGIPIFIFMVVFLGISGFISASEVAIFSLSPEQINTLDKSKQKKHKAILTLLDHPKKLLASLLIANNTANIGIVVLFTYVNHNLFQLGGNEWYAFLLEVMIMTLVILIFGEVIPKVYANSEPYKVSEIVSIPLLYMDKVLSPVSNLLVNSTGSLDRLLSAKAKNISVDELSHALEITSRGGMDPTNDKKILEGIVKFGTIDVSEIMCSRVHVAAIDIDTTFSELIQYIQEQGFSRLPVYRETFDKIEGILYLKDLIPFIDEKNYAWNALIRPPYFVPENKKIDNLLKDFQEKKIHMAIVVDEYGGTSGIVTLEDILEEIVGDITDEYDDDELIYSKLDDANYVFEAKTMLKDVLRILNIDGTVFDEIRGDSDTLAGFVLELFERIPVKGEKANFDRYQFTVESSDRRRIKQVKITILSEIENL